MTLCVGRELIIVLKGEFSSPSTTPPLLLLIWDRSTPRTLFNYESTRLCGLCSPQGLSYHKKTKYSF